MSLVLMCSSCALAKWGQRRTKLMLPTCSPSLPSILEYLRTDFIFSSGMLQLMRWHGKEQLSRIFLENKVVKPKYIQPSRNPNVSNFFHYCFQKKGNKLRLKLCQAQVQLKLKLSLVKLLLEIKLTFSSDF